MDIVELLKIKVVLFFLILLASLPSATYAGGRSLTFIDAATDQATAFRTMATGNKPFKQTIMVHMTLHQRMGSHHSSSHPIDGNPLNYRKVTRMSRRILTVQTNDYGSYDPPPTHGKPPFKLTPN